MRGMSRENGTAVEELKHLGQSIRDILTTAVGTRVMRRDYGSELPRLVDRPINDPLLVDLYAATAEAIDRWEPRVDLRSVTIDSASPGSVTLTLRGVYRPDGRELVLEGIVV